MRQRDKETGNHKMIENIDSGMQSPEGLKQEGKEKNYGSGREGFSNHFMPSGWNGKDCRWFSKSERKANQIRKCREN